MGQSTNCCPSGPDGGTALCLETLLGVTRCFSPDSPDGCFTDGADCTFGDECCSGICLPDEQGNLTCSGACSPLGSICTTNGDCCDAALCIDFVCMPNVNECTPLGASCEDAAECCSGICYESGVCVGDLE